MIKTKFLSISLITMMTLNYVDATDAIDELKSNGPDITTSSKLLSPMQSIPLEKNTFKNNKPKLGEEVSPDDDNVYIVEDVEHGICLKDIVNNIKNKTVKIIDYTTLCCFEDWEQFVFNGFEKGLILEGNEGRALLQLNLIDDDTVTNIDVYDFLILNGRVDIFYNGKITMQKSRDSIVPIIDVSNLSDNLNDDFDFGDCETIIDGNGYTTLKYLTDEELGKKEIPSIDEIRNRIKNILNQGLRLQNVNIYNCMVQMWKGGAKLNNRKY